VSDSSSDNTNGTIKDIPDVDAGVEEQDSAAKKEQDAIFSDEYEEDRKRQDHLRQQRLKNTVFWVLCGMVSFGAFGLLFLGTVWLIHAIAPVGWRWLSQGEFEHIQTLLFSGSISAAITLLGSKLFR